MEQTRNEYRLHKGVKGQDCQSYGVTPELDPEYPVALNIPNTSLNLSRCNKLPARIIRYALINYPLHII